MVMAAAFDPKGRCRKVFVRADALEIELTDTAKLLLPLRG
jgi:hypothetical protein